MVIGKDFAWAHLPKTGGDATLSMFRVFIDLVEFADREDSNDKHANFRGRAQRMALGEVVRVRRERAVEQRLRPHHHLAHGGMTGADEPNHHRDHRAVRVDQAAVPDPGDGQPDLVQVR